MPLTDKLQAWLDTAAAQIRWKRARPEAARELAAHLMDQRAALLAEGMGETEADAATVAEMGDPVEIGTALDRAYRPKPDWFLLIWVIALAAAGLIVQTFAGRSSGYTDIEGVWQLAAFAGGVLCLLAGYFADFTLLAKHPWVCYGAWLALLTGFLMLGGEQTKYVLKLQYFALIIPIVYTGILYALRRHGIYTIPLSWLALLPMVWMQLRGSYYFPLALALTVCFVLCVHAARGGAFGQPCGTATALACLPLGLLTAVAGGRLLTDPSLRDTLLAQLDPARDLSTAGYCPALIRDVLAHGADAPQYLAETAVGRSMIDGDAPTDLLLIWARKSGGWLLFLALAAVVVVLLARGFQLEHRQKGLLAKQVMLAVLLPLTLRFALYVLFNLGFTMGASAMALPLLMYGRTDLCVTMLLLGLMLSTVRTGSLYARYSGAPRSPETPSRG